MSGTGTADGQSPLVRGGARGICKVGTALAGERGRNDTVCDLVPIGKEEGA